jgi:CRP/FNR family cyclic AMP-dependent transcriptional regulator
MEVQADSVLTGIPLFAGLSKGALTIISSHASTKSHPKNTVILSEGDKTDSLYVILSGRVKAYASDEDGKEIILSLQGPGEYFGEMALLDEGPRSASVMTLEPTRLAIISKQTFRECLANNPNISFDLIRQLVLRGRRLTDSVKSLGLNDVYARMVRKLLDFATERDGELVIEQRLTHQDIANMVGSSREMVSRIMKELSRGGYIAVADKKITIKKQLPTAW